MKLYLHNGRCNCSGRQIRLARDTQKLSQENLANRLNSLGLEIDQRAISRIETGLRVVPDYELAYFAKALQVDILWLLGV